MREARQTAALASISEFLFPVKILTGFLPGFFLTDQFPRGTIAVPD
jgi:hypothetical protein